MSEEKMSFHNEKKVISSHNDEKTKAIKTRFAIEALSFLGITIGFSLSLYNTYRNYRNLNQQLNGIE
jgi:hypothetical protein|tara:strand:- start:1459 stop:1659 length:201 start_codon:yes stop_codon:yes gene_type:complete